MPLTTEEELVAKSVVDRNDPASLAIAVEGATIEDDNSKAERDLYLGIINDMGADAVQALIDYKNVLEGLYPEVIPLILDMGSTFPIVYRKNEAPWREGWFLPLAGHSSVQAKKMVIHESYPNDVPVWSSFVLTARMIDRAGIEVEKVLTYTIIEGDESEDIFLDYINWAAYPLKNMDGLLVKGASLSCQVLETVSNTYNYGFNPWKILTDYSIWNHTDFPVVKLYASYNDADQDINPVATLRPEDYTFNIGEPDIEVVNPLYHNDSKYVSARITYDTISMVNQEETNILPIGGTAQLEGIPVDYADVNITNLNGEDPLGGQEGYEVDYTTGLITFLNGSMERWFDLYGTSSENDYNILVDYAYLNTGTFDINAWGYYSAKTGGIYSYDIDTSAASRFAILRITIQVPNSDINGSLVYSAYGFTNPDPAAPTRSLDHMVFHYDVGSTHKTLLCSLISPGTPYSESVLINGVSTVVFNYFLEISFNGDKDLAEAVAKEITDNIKTIEDSPGSPSRVSLVNSYDLDLITDYKDLLLFGPEDLKAGESEELKVLWKTLEDFGVIHEALYHKVYGVSHKADGVGAIKGVIEDRADNAEKRDVILSELI